MNIIMYIYIIKNIVNGKYYIGKTISSVDKRCYRHVNESFNINSSGYDFVFHKAIRKYGISSFQLFNVLDYSNLNITEYQLSQLEIEYIEKYRTFIRFSDCNGYNSTLGGEGVSGNGVSIDMYDKTLNFIKTFNSIEEAARILKLQATNIQSVVRGRCKSAGNYIFCETGDDPQPFVDEHRVLIDMYDLDMNFIMTHQSMKSAADYIDCNITTIFDCCNEKQVTCKGYIFVYHGVDVSKRRLNLINKNIDLYCAKTKNFIKTFPTIISLIKADIGLKKSIIQRCLRTNNHLAGNYLVVPKGTKLTE